MTGTGIGGENVRREPGAVKAGNCGLPTPSKFSDNDSVRQPDTTT